MSGKNSTADSVTKLHDTLAETLSLDAVQKSTANWKAAQRVAWGDKFHEADAPPARTDEMIAVDSKITTNHYHGTPPETSRPGLGTLAKLGIGAALVASGAGIPAGVGMLLSGAKDVVSQPQVTVPAEPSAPVSPAPPTWILELGKPE